MDPLNLTDGQQAEKNEIFRKKKIKADKDKIARLKKCQYTAEYQKEYREYSNNYQKDYYNTTSEVRKKKEERITRRIQSLSKRSQCFK